MYSFCQTINSKIIYWLFLRKCYDFYILILCPLRLFVSNPTDCMSGNHIQPTKVLLRVLTYRMSQKLLRQPHPTRNNFIWNKSISNDLNFPYSKTLASFMFHVSWWWCSSSWGAVVKQRLSVGKSTERRLLHDFCSNLLLAPPPLYLYPAKTFT